MIDGLNCKDSIGINVEGHFNLRHAPECLWQAFQCELAEVVVVLDHSSFTFVHIDVHMILIVLRGGKVLALIGWDRTVALNQLLHHPA
mmetsp:Transcript_11603/g.29266  ORF Transcript_11603/g.29266 Transcript_11603/m.29266 type:complete len:88 (+) Transcript_11603:538-801(+)